MPNWVVGQKSPYPVVDTVIIIKYVATVKEYTEYPSK
jgi:hypothetical protein